MPTKPLNQYAISQVLGSLVKPIGPLTFGGFGVLRTAAEIVKNTPLPRAAEPTSFEDDAAVVAAFEKMRDGHAADRLLWDIGFAAKFAEQCRRDDISLPPQLAVRRVIAIRKSPGRAKAKGIVLSPTTRKESHPAPRDRDICAIEYALVRLRYRYGVSIDDVLIEPALGQEFERVAGGISGTASSQDLRLGALYLRKTRDSAKGLPRYFPELVIDAFEAAMSDMGPLSALRMDDLPKGPGVMKLVEPSRHLYVAEYGNLSESLEPFLTGGALGIMADPFWTPDQDQIRLGLFVGRTFQDVPVHQWDLKLIHVRHPVFNWPVREKAA